MIDFDRELPLIVLGDTRAFSRWVAAAEPILRTSLRGFAAVVDAEAVVQETLLRAWQVAHRIEPDGRPNCLLRWALKVARNLAVSQCRRPGQLVPEPRECPVEPREPDPALRAAVEDCVGKLPRQPRAALLARFAVRGGEDDSTLAERLHMKVNTFLQNLTRGRRALVDCLGSKGIAWRFDESE